MPPWFLSPSQGHPQYIYQESDQIPISKLLEMGISAFNDSVEDSDLLSVLFCLYSLLHIEQTHQHTPFCPF